MVRFLKAKIERGVGLAGFKVDLLPFYLVEWVPFVIEFDEVGHMDLIGIFPSVIALRVSLPFDEVLQGPETSLVSMGADLIHFILLFSFNQIRRRLGEVWAMCRGFVIG